MSVYDQHLEHDSRPSGAVMVLGVTACGTLVLPFVVLAAHAAGLSWVWASVLGLLTPSLFLLLWGVVLVAVVSGSRQDEVVVPIRRRSSLEPAAEVASAA